MMCSDNSILKGTYASSVYMDHTILSVYPIVYMVVVSLKLTLQRYMEHYFCRLTSLQKLWTKLMRPRGIH